MKNNRITLIPMTEPGFQADLAHAIEAYAQDKIRTGNWSQDEALERSLSEFETNRAAGC